MLVLLTAIHARFTAAPALAAAFPGGLWTALVPAGTPMPFAVVTVVASPRSASYRSSMAEVTTQFAGFGTDHDAVGAGMEALTAAFDDATQPLPAGEIFDARRLDEPTPTAMPPNGQGLTVWRWTTSYRFAVDPG